MRKLALAVLLAVLLTGSALADVARGAYGQEVFELQQLLVDLGYLSEEPDGAFGPNTDKALRAWQAQAGLPVTGRTNAALMARLRADRDALMNPQPGGHCAQTLVSGGVRVDYCLEHQPLYEQSEALLGQQGYAALAQIVPWWEEAVSDLFTRWTQQAGAEGKLTALSAYGAWQKAFEQQKAALTATLSEGEAQYQIYLMLRNQTVSLCSLLTDEAAAGEDEYGE